MMQCKVDMSVPQVQLLDFNVLGDTVGGEDEIMAGIYLQVEGDIQGNMMFIQKKVSAAHLINKMMAGMIEIKDEEVADYEFGEMECSAIKEVGNIITGAYLNSLSSMTNLTVIPSPPAVTVDMAGAIWSYFDLLTEFMDRLAHGLRIFHLPGVFAYLLCGQYNSWVTHEV